MPVLLRYSTWFCDTVVLVARGNILRSGRTLIVTQANVFALEKGEESLCAVMQQTIMVIHAKQET